MSSPFASLTVSDRIPLPFDEGQWVQVRKLTGRESDQAQDAHRSAFASGRISAWSATFRRALEKGATDPQVMQALNDPLTGYDRFVVAKAGLVAWSYDRAIDAAAVEDLDDAAVDFIAREVLRRTKPKLFESAEDAEAARKNG